MHCLQYSDGFDDECENHRSRLRRPIGREGDSLRSLRHTRWVFLRHALSPLCSSPGYMAPELLRCSQSEDSPGYGLPVDLWACGVILYTLLSGLPPFWHRKQHLMFRMIMDGQYTVKGSEWDDVSETAKDLIEHLLVVDPSERFTAEQALQHPFFNNERTRRRDFLAKRTLKAHLILVWSISRLRTLHYRPQPIRGKEILGKKKQLEGVKSLIVLLNRKSLSIQIVSQDDRFHGLSSLRTLDQER